MDRSLHVRCEATNDGGWRCAVTVGEDPAATHHEVEVTPASLASLDPGATEPEALVRAAFEFLLAHEPRESILRTFELSVIGRYFFGWEDDVRRRIERGPSAE